MYAKTHIIFTEKKVDLKIGVAYGLLKKKKSNGLISNGSKSIDLCLFEHFFRRIDNILDTFSHNFRSKK